MVLFAVYLLFIYSQRVMPTSFFRLQQFFMHVDDNLLLPVGLYNGKLVMFVVYLFTESNAHQFLHIITFIYACG